jgi:hypothetical protein
MTTLSDALRGLQQRYPSLLEFVRWLPYGIVAEDVEHSDACIQTYPAYCYAACNAAMGAEKIIPGLVRLAVATVEGRGMEVGDGTTTFHEELTWFYSYARAIGLTGLSPGMLLSQGVRTRWESVAGELLTKERLDLFDAIRATLITRYGVLEARLLAKVIPRKLDLAWEVAAQSSSFSEFLGQWTKAGMPVSAPRETSSFCKNRRAGWSHTIVSGGARVCSHRPQPSGLVAKSGSLTCCIPPCIGRSSSRTTTWIDRWR